MHKLLIVFLVCCTTQVSSQILVNNGAALYAGPGALISVKGGLLNKSNAQLQNAGEVVVTSDFNNQGTYQGSGKLVFSGSLSKQFQTVQSVFGKLMLDSFCGEVNVMQQLRFDDTIYIGSNAVLNNSIYDLHLNGFVMGPGSVKTYGNANLMIGGSGDAGYLRMSGVFPGVSNRFNQIQFTRTGSIGFADTIIVAQAVSIQHGTVYSNGFLKLRSDSAQTAYLLPLVSGGDLAGAVTVERFVPAVMRRYRILSTPTLQATLQQLVDDIYISGTGGSTNGFDHTSSNGGTFFSYQEDTAGNRGWKAAPNISQQLIPGSGSLVFIRGDRSLPAPDWYSMNTQQYPLTGGFPAQNKVTIDFHGPVNKGTIVKTLSYTHTNDSNSDGWNLIGNPYPCPVDWNNLTKTGIEPFYYSLNPATGSYEAMDGSALIASAQGFFVHAVSANPSVTFTESAKSASTPASHFKSGKAELKITMWKDSLSSDFSKLIFDHSVSKRFNFNKDARKLNNSRFNIATWLKTDSIFVQLHTLPLENNPDTVYLKVEGSSGSYKLQFYSSAPLLSQCGQLLLIDKFSQTITDIKQVGEYVFSITASPLSQGADRFYIVTQKNQTLPLTLLEFNGRKVANASLLHWTTANEFNIQHFEIERATENGLFETIGTVKATGLTHKQESYQFIDETPHPEMNYYRLRMIEADGKYSYSSVALVWFGSAIKAQGDIHCIQNPFTGLLRFKIDEGIATKEFDIDVYNSFGTKVATFKAVSLNNNLITLDLSALKAAIYDVRFTNKASSGEINIKVLKL